MAIEFPSYRNYVSEEHKKQVHREGPFVVSTTNNGCRVEVECPGSCTCLPDNTIYALCKENNWRMSRSYYQTEAEVFKTVDKLNELYAEGVIVQVEEENWYYFEVDSSQRV